LQLVSEIQETILRLQRIELLHKLVRAKKQMLAEQRSREEAARGATRT
jgi:hypothetical protein